MRRHEWLKITTFSVWDGCVVLYCSSINGKKCGPMKVRSSARNFPAYPMVARRTNRASGTSRTLNELQLKIQLTFQSPMFHTVCQSPHTLLDLNKSVDFFTKLIHQRLQSYQAVRITVSRCLFHVEGYMKAVLLACR